MSTSGHTNASMALVAGASFTAGCLIGSLYLSAKAQVKVRYIRTKLMDFINGEQSTRPSRSAFSSTGDLVEDHENASGEDEAPTLKLALLVRTDTDLGPRRLLEASAWTVLGAFKKLYKRRDPNLKAWELGGEKLITLAAPSEDDMILVQQGARTMSVPTHTFAGKNPYRKERTIMTVGPATEEILSQLTMHLKRL